MDHRSIKRPRSESSAAGESKGTTKPVKPAKKKKQKKSKAGKSNVSEEQGSTSTAGESMATAEGQTMTQVLSTFNRMEHNRFEAFKRSTFRGDAIAAYVTHCLAASHERAHVRGEKTRQLMGSDTLGIGGEDITKASKPLHKCPYILMNDTSTATLLNNFSSSNSSTGGGHENTKMGDVVVSPKIANNHNNGNHARRNDSESFPPYTCCRPRRRMLEDMVAPGQAEEITVVVSALAKAYAQRLITAARRVASSIDHHFAQQNGRDGFSALLPKHVLLAHQARVAAGLDPGFFLQATPLVATNVTPGSCAVSAAALGIVNRHELERNAALAAQEEYDLQKQEEAKKQQEKQLANEQQEKQKQDEKEDTKEESMEDVLMNEMEEG